MVGFTASNDNRREEVNSRLKEYLDEFGNEIARKIINEKVARQIFDNLELGVKPFLIELFGKEKDTKDLGLMGDLLKYQDAGSNPFCDAVIFAYWSHKGDRENYIHESKGFRRENFFYKGRRWSDGLVKDRFYAYFRIIEKSVNGNTPVKFFTAVGMNNDKEYFRVISGFPETDERTIRLPCLDELSALKLPALDALLGTIKSMKATNSWCDPRLFEDTKKSMTVDRLRKEFSAAFEEIKSSNKGLIKNWCNEIMRVIGKLGGENEGEILRKVFDVVISYQYYDHPYDVHFFLPRLNENKKAPHSALIITLRTGSAISDGQKQIILKLANTLGKLAIIEEVVWKNLTRNLSIYWQWKEYYQDWQGKYERISEIAINICKAICQRKKINFLYTPYRVKKFQSFYDKIIDIANNPSKKHDEIRRAKLFHDAILGATTEDAKYIFNDIRDIAGARLVCLYENDIKKIKSELWELKKRGEIKFTKRDDEKDYDQSQTSAKNPEKKNEFDYRSYHLTFRLNGPRLKLYEYEDLRDLRCEIQIRTILADGWANVSHELVYKSDLMSSQINLLPADFKGRLNSISGTLFNTDKQFDDLKETVEKAIREYES